MSLTISTRSPVDCRAIEELGFDDALTFAKGETRLGPGGGVYGHTGMRVESRADPLHSSPDEALREVLNRIKDVDRFEEWSRGYERWITLSVTGLTTKAFFDISNRTLEIIARAGLDLNINVMDLFDPER